jgi:nicotinamide-nucleotide amidase
MGETQMRAEIIAIGDELTSGQRLDTNSQWLSQQLGELGVPVLFHTTVGDELEACESVFRLAIDRADLIVVTGGLGPTADDLTRQAIAQATGTELVLDEASLEHIRALFARRRRPMPEQNVVQAMFPRGSRVIPNPHGTAPGIDMDVPRAGQNPSRIFALPGVPAEMREMWHATVAGTIQECLGERRMIRHRRIHCFGAGESDIEKMLPDLIRRGRIPAVGITASQATITLRITAEGPTPEACYEAMQPTADTIYQCLGHLVFGEEDDRLEDVIVRILAGQGQTLASIESDSEGTLAHCLSRADPDQRVVRGGMVVRDAHVRTRLASSDRASDGVVGGPDGTELQTLACRCRELFGTDYALALGSFPPTSAASGPAPRVDIVLAGPAGVETRSAPYAGHPDILLARTVKEALNFLRLALTRDF